MTSDSHKLIHLLALIESPSSCASSCNHWNSKRDFSTFLLLLSLLLAFAVSSFCRFTLVLITQQWQYNEINWVSSLMNNSDRELRYLFSLLSQQLSHTKVQKQFQFFLFIILILSLYFVMFYFMKMTIKNSNLQILTVK